MMSTTKHNDTPDIATKPTEVAESSDDAGLPLEEDTLKSVALFFLENCTAHGLPRVAAERSIFRKLIWVVIFAGALGYFCFTLQNIITTYLKYEVNVNTVLRSRDQVIFPAVTVCNLNRLRRAYLNGTNYESILQLDDTYRHKIEPAYHVEFVDPNVLAAGAKDIPAIAPIDPDEPEYDDDYLYNYIDLFGTEESDALFQVDSSEIYSVTGDYDFKGFLANAKTNDYSDLQDILRPNKTEYDKMGHQKQELIIQCSFDRANCNITDNFSHTYSTGYGNCYTFNSGMYGRSPQKTNRFGSVYGLRLTLDVQVEHYLGMFTQETGVRVSVHHPDVYPFPESNGFNAPIGKSTTLAIRTTLVERQPYPYISYCASSGGHDLAFDGSYTLESCQLSCYRKELLRRCNCVDTVLNTVDEPRCGYVNRTQVICRQKVKHDYSHHKLSCLENCTEPCWDMTYDADASYVEWPNERYSYFLADQLRNATGDQNLTTKEIKESMARVHVYMDTFQLLNIIESPAYTWDSLLADCGGTLGLFIGLSVCTALEFMELILDCIIVLTRKCCRRYHGSGSKASQVKPIDSGKSV